MRVFDKSLRWEIDRTKMNPDDSLREVQTPTYRIHVKAPRRRRRRRSNNRGKEKDPDISMKGGVSDTQEEEEGEAVVSAGIREEKEKEEKEREEKEKDESSGEDSVRRVSLTLHFLLLHADMCFTYSKLLVT